MEWQPIETAPMCKDILCAVTFSVGVKGDGGTEWVTEIWVDFQVSQDDWAFYPHLIHIPAPPTRWMPLPEAPAALSQDAKTTDET